MDTTLRDRVFAAIQPQIPELMLELLPSGNKTARVCPFHKDKTPSLSFNKVTSAWKCHGCDEKGDIFSLWMKLNSKGFGEALRYYANIGRVQLRDPNSRPASEVLTMDDKTYASWFEGWRSGSPSDEVIQFHKTRYGLDKQDWVKNRLFWNTYARRLWIPVFGTNSDLVVDIRQHDTMRVHCTWTDKSGADTNRPPLDLIARQEHPDAFPSWKKAGKVLSVTGHGSPTLFHGYWLSNSNKGEIHYIVGGELKCLLMRKLGYTAFSFTGGEGKSDPRWLPYFHDRKVRIIMDPDDAGVKALDRLSKLMMEAGCAVEIGMWSPAATLMLPPKGDITDLLLQAGAASIEDPQLIRWIDITKEYMAPLADDESDTDWSKVETIRFAALADPRNFGEKVQVSAVVSGMGDNPYQVPHKVVAQCEFGRSTELPECKRCRLAQGKANWVGSAEMNVLERLDMCGKNHEITDSLVRAKLGIPAKCRRAALTMQMSSVQPVVLTTPPSWEESSQGGFIHRPCSLIYDQQDDIIPNTQYTMGGTAMASPQNNSFIFAAERLVPSDNTALSWRFDVGNHNDLKNAIRGLTVMDKVTSIVNDWRDHNCKIYDQDEMLISIMLSMFMPFEFYLGDDLCMRKCPHVCILGDSNVGKSTSANRAIQFWGGGRFIDFSQQPTYAGLIGGAVTTTGGKQIFNWGAFPSANRTWVAMDEFNKMFTKDIGALTGTLSSGVAARKMAGVDASTTCYVRFLSMANCRDNPMGKKLYYMDRNRQLYELFGSSQDLGRVEFAHIESQVGKRDFNSIREPVRKTPLYTSPLARYHLGWAWQMDKDKIHIDLDSVLTHTAELDGFVGDKCFLTLSPQLKWKVSRVAAGFAMICYNADNDPSKRGHVNVEDVHIRAACKWLLNKFQQLRVGQKPIKRQK
jgi:hypothetical protein